VPLWPQNAAQVAAISGTKTAATSGWIGLALFKNIMLSRVK
jgi:hypothetical protein